MINFAESRFKVLYAAANPRGMNSRTVLLELRDLILLYAVRNGVPWAEAEAFFDRVLRHIPEEVDEGLDRVDVRMQHRDRLDDHCWDSEGRVRCAVRAWTCDETLSVGHREVEVCFILNDAIRNDAEPILHPAARLTRFINMHCCKLDSHTWPNGINSTTPNMTYRGGGLPAEHHAWFVPGKLYRSRQYIATSFSIDVAHSFVRRQLDEPVIWEFQLEWPCLHGNLITPQLAGLPGEAEFLLAPYTVFRVLSKTWQYMEASPLMRTLRIRLSVASDNQAHSEQLPLAPWS